LTPQSCTHGAGGRRETGQAWQYCCGISYEYLNDISIRDAIELILGAAPKDATRSLAAQMAALDERLYVLYVHRPEQVASWWRKGLPAGIVE
jgi:hypothetical protein